MTFVETPQTFLQSLVPIGPLVSVQMIISEMGNINDDERQWATDA